MAYNGNPSSWGQRRRILRVCCPASPKQWALGSQQTPASKYQVVSSRRQCSLLPSCVQAQVSAPIHMCTTCTHHVYTHTQKERERECIHVVMKSTGRCATLLLMRWIQIKTSGTFIRSNTWTTAYSRSSWRGRTREPPVGAERGLKAPSPSGVHVSKKAEHAITVPHLSHIS